jgi:hypothetical protein
MPRRKKNPPPQMSDKICSVNYIVSIHCYKGSKVDNAAGMDGMACGCPACKPEFWCSATLAGGRGCERPAHLPTPQGEERLCLLCAWQRSEVGREAEAEKQAFLRGLNAFLPASSGQAEKVG